MLSRRKRNYFAVYKLVKWYNVMYKMKKMTLIT